MPAQRKYPQDLRDRAVKMVFDLRQETGEKTGTIARVADRLGIHREALRTWIRQAVRHEVAWNEWNARKEVRLMSSAFIICHNPAQAIRDKAAREQAIERIEAELERIAAQRARERQRDLGDKARAKAEAAHVRAECALRDHPTLKRWIRQQKNGRLVIDRAKIKAEERRDGKYLLATSDHDISAEDAALGYKNLLEAERGFRDMKATLQLRPVFHRAGAPHPRPRADLLAGPVADPRSRTRHRPALAPRQPRTPPHPHRTGRDRHSDHADHIHPDHYLQGARDQPPRSGISLRTCLNPSI
ncbi:hypothetical protein Mth01_46940 [Sphaerimonospora thailandensis]|uniref:Transposase n=1 Tax=Sphaerimonospora thailandensis TaxID=795644 RepID=A0A8J3RDU1_9ACTN|nr:transposase [Sphaerimonospora thailandensis]GIH72441.1 hypothetical protein Mth01_46940 [Sphaerimonospora thailandensis]